MRSPKSPPKMKCCGLSNLVDVQSVVALGYDYAGIIRVPNTPRYATREFLTEASLYTEGGSTQLVAVYQNASRTDILEDVAQTSGLKVVQLHGDETPAIVKVLCMELPQTVELWKVFNLLEPPETETLKAYAPYLKAIILDLPKGYKGDFSWDTLAEGPVLETIATARAYGLAVLLAGRLTPATAGDVLHRFSPDGLDVASGVETLSGQKDYAMLQAFVHQAL